jgi:hypothetical protein
MHTEAANKVRVGVGVDADNPHPITMLHLDPREHGLHPAPLPRRAPGDEENEDVRARIDHASLIPRTG